jgi:hypothetical protein
VTRFLSQIPIQKALATGHRDRPKPSLMFDRHPLDVNTLMTVHQCHMKVNTRCGATGFERAAAAPDGQSLPSVRQVLGAITISIWLLAFVVVGVPLTVAYNLKLLGGRLHSDLWFAFAWGAFPVLTSYWRSPVQ